MSVFADMIDVLRVKRSEMIGKAKNVVGVFLASPERDPDDESAPADDESEAAEWWQHYGFASRPPADAEVLTARVGNFFAGIASRVIATASVYGMLKDGDVALYSVGKNVLRLNADGSVTLLKLTANGQHLVVTVTKNDDIMAMVPNGPVFEMSAARGLTINSPSAPVTISSGVSVQIVAPQFVNACGAVKLHVGAVRPLVDTVGMVPNVFI